MTIIGFRVDALLMRIDMPDSARDDLRTAIASFCTVGRSKSSKRKKLRDFQRLAGWVNWALNVYPLLRPGLASLYAKISGKSQPNSLCFVSVAIIRDLTWISDHLQKSSGVFFFKAIAWLPEEADLIIFADASFQGIGFWSPTENVAFYGDVPSNHPKGVIFFFEAYAVLCALRWVASSNKHPSRLTIYSDNENTVDMFNSLHTLPQYNDLLTEAVDILMKHNIDLRVDHIPGVRNIVADQLSRRLFDLILRSHPELQINFYTPTPSEQWVSPS